MIISFTISNSRSFSEAQTLDLVASKRFTSHENHAVALPGMDERVLRTGVIYGANGAGKSNLFRGLRYVQKMVLTPLEKNSGTGRQAFQFGAPEKEPSEFVLRFLSNGSVYEFGFKADDNKILEERLTKAEGGKDRPIYERRTDDQGKVTIEAKKLGDNLKMKALATVGGPQNQTFLATIRATLEFSDYGEDIRNVFDWFETKLRLIRPTDHFRSLGNVSEEDPDFLKFASAFLKASSTGIDALRINKKEISEDEIRTLIPAHVAERVLSRRNPNGSAILRFNNETEIRVERTDKDHYYRVTVGAEHEHRPGERIVMDISEESDGTRRLLQLIPVLHQLRFKGGVFFIDEIDRSMHPLLVRMFLDFFLKSCGGDHRQVIVTTHESSLLDLELLRRDEIWFTEKGPEGASRLYSLASFQVRKDLEIRKHYLQGRFGAIPFIGDVDSLLEENSSKS